MKAEELDKVERAMSDALWSTDGLDILCVCCRFVDGTRGQLGWLVQDDDVQGVTILRNHARALIDLVRAVGKRKATLCYSVSVHEPERARECQCGALYAPECPIRAADAAVLTAHAAVEAVT